MENRARDKKLFALPSFSHRVDVLFSIRTPSLSVSRRVFTYLRSFRYRASTFAIHLILRLSSSSSSFPPPPLSSLPPSSSSSSSSSASSSSSFSTFDQRRRLVALLSSSSLSSFSFFFPPLLFLRSRTIKPPPPPTTHSVPLQCCERRCRHARRLIFGRTFRFGVLYWTVQKWHLPVSELTSCQVSVSFARAVPGRWRACVRAYAHTRVAMYALCVYTRICVSRRRPAFFPTLYTRHYLTSLSRACSRSPPYERDSALRSVVLRAYGIRVLLRMRVPPSPPRTGTRMYGLPPCVARRRRRPLVASFR